MVGYPDLEKRIRELEEAIRMLQEENQHLRSAARAFGDLAERLNLSLDAERRQAADRRQWPRPTEDRRRAELVKGSPPADDAVVTTCDSSVRGTQRRQQ